MGLFSGKKQRADLPARRQEALRVRREARRSLQTNSDGSSLYRAGRTLPGATSARLYSAEARAIKTATPREKVHHLSYVRRRIAGVLAVVVAVLVGILIFLWQFTATVIMQADSRIAIPQSDLQEYAQSIQQYLSDNPTERLRFNTNKTRLNEAITRRHPEVREVVQVGAAGFTSTKFFIQLRKPVVSWRVDDAQYYVDAQGVSFTKNVFDNPAVTIADNSGVRHTPGTAIASARFLSFVGRAVAAVQVRGLVVQQVSIPAGTSRQIELALKDVDYPFILSIDRSAREQVEDISRGLVYFSNRGIKPRYVDLRVKGKAFYRD